MTDPQAELREVDVLPSLDAVVVTRLGSGTSHVRASTQKVIYLWPGAKDHAASDANWGAYDHVLVAGEKSRAWLTAYAGLEAGQISIVGCPQFDLPVPSTKSPFDGDGRKIVLYNPHHSPELSSWFRWGRAILDWFVEHDDHLLIFAPHVRLFDRRLVWAKDQLLPLCVGRIDERYAHAPNIHIDLGGEMSAARLYAEHADIYIGDAGGLLYEFVARPRPCAFLNAHNASAGTADPRFFNWNAGYVIDDPNLLRSHLHTAQEWHADVYRPIQQEMFAHSISITDTPASRRAAIAIDRIASV